MKIILLFFCFTIFAQDELSQIDSKIYSVKNKGIQDIAFTMTDRNLTKRLNDQKIFGSLKEVGFRVYWTSNPEKVDLEVIGMPEGFFEVKNELKRSVAHLLEVFFPPSMKQKFNGYKINKLPQGQEYEMLDEKGVLPVLKLRLKLDQNLIPLSIVGEKAIGSLEINYGFKKEQFADGKYVLRSETIKSQENGFVSSVNKIIDYSKVQGVSVVSKITIENETKAPSPKLPSLKSREEILVTDYRINSGEALKYFLSLGQKK